MNTTFHWIVRLLVLFPVIGATAGTLVCWLIDFEPLVGAVFGAVEGTVFGSMVVWPSMKIPFWRIALFTIAGTVLLGSSGAWAWKGELLGAIYLSPIGFWVGFAALVLSEYGLSARQSAS